MDEKVFQQQRNVNLYTFIMISPISIKQQFTKYFRQSKSEKNLTIMVLVSLLLSESMYRENNIFPSATLDLCLWLPFQFIQVIKIFKFKYEHLPFY
mmetsp:Transcript_1647/g.1888  ORF Transcript_1647/g.1888 Transcript_1647/m.1888 type:complete len:96 (-) Transcript_1647:99-386(-)